MKDMKDIKNLFGFMRFMLFTVQSKEGPLKKHAFESVGQTPYVEVEQETLSHSQELMRRGSLIDRLEQPRPERRVYFYGAANDRIAQGCGLNLHARPTSAR